jgi:SAM-dependent methyltransferase
METARLFNSALAACAISSAFEIGLLDELECKGVVHISSHCHNADLHVPTVEGIFRALACFNIVELSSDQTSVTRGPIFSDVYREKGYFFWLIRGYGFLLQNLADLASNANRPSGNDSSFVRRSLKHIALAGRDYGAQLVDPIFEKIINERPFSVACDLGCGTAERLIKIVESRPEAQGIGIDTNQDVIAVAENAVGAKSLDRRVMLMVGDIKDLAPLPEFGEVDLLFSFFLGHDLWPREMCKRVLERLHTIFPRAQRFLFCDTYRSDVTPSPFIPTFTLGFELTHAVMGQYIPSETEWLSLFQEAGWTCFAKEEIDIPFSAIFDLRP